MNHNNFAEFYDNLTKNVNYTKRAERLHYIIQKYIQTDTDGTLLLDLACGSGSLSEELAKLGYDVIGVDNSPAMLNQAMQKKLESNLEIQYLCQDMRELDMFGTIDITVCMLDSLNHLDSLEDIQKVFQKVSLFAQPKGLFIFDMNTLYKHHEILNNQVFLYDTDEVFCVWENHLKNNTVEMQLTFFALQQDNNCYYRTDEFITETAYPVQEIETALKYAGLELIAKFDADAKLDTPESLSPVSEHTERILFIARKPEML
ncbi:MAG: methyltransferase domain-containing protein [Oscillospiraceae bacterium]|nr:methyltransferase domain-containing protein [Oscillospiraceae bacterium]